MITKTPQLDVQTGAGRAPASSGWRENAPRPERRDVAEVVEAGAIAGLAGGVAMAILAVLYAGIAGLGFLSPIRAIAMTLVGTHAAYEMGPVGVVVLGLVIHVVVSIVFGIVFAALMPAHVPASPSLALALFAGVSILVLMSLVVLPVVNPVARSHLMWGSSPGVIPVVVAFAMHLVYGAGLSLAPMLRRRLRERPIVTGHHANAT